MSSAQRAGVTYPGITVVFLCHDGQGNVLLNKRGERCRDERGCWDCGGGRVECGQKVKDTLRREIAEEYCTTVVEQVFLGYRDVHRTVGGVSTHWVTLDFAVRIDPVQADNGEPHKFESVAWYSLDALPAPLHSQFPRFLDLYREELLRHGIVRKH